MASLVQQELFDWPVDPRGTKQAGTAAQRAPRPVSQEPGPEAVEPHDTDTEPADGQASGHDHRRHGRHVTGCGAQQEDRHRQRMERFLTEQIRQGQGQTASAARQVRIDQEYGPDLFLRLSGQANTDTTGQDGPQTRGSGAGRPGRRVGADRRAISGAQTAVPASSVLFETGRQARWQILSAAMRFALAAYAPAFAFSRGFWDRLQELLDRHEACLAPDCRPLVEGTGLLRTAGDGIFGTAPVRVDTPADPQVPTAEAVAGTDGRPTASVVGLLRFMREAGGF